jgi:hypothetical protein
VVKLLCMGREWDEKVFFCPGFLHGELVRCKFTLAIDLCLKRRDMNGESYVSF